MIFLLATCAALMGINEKNFFDKEYKHLPVGTAVGNALGTGNIHHKLFLLSNFCTLRLIALSIAFAHNNLSRCVTRCVTLSALAFRRMHRDLLNVGLLPGVAAVVQADRARRRTGSSSRIL